MMVVHGTIRANLSHSGQRFVAPLMTTKGKECRSPTTTRLETVVVSVYWHNGLAWTSKPEVQEYRFQCMGERTGKGWKLHGAQPDMALPPFGRRGEAPQFTSALTQALSEALGGVPVIKYGILTVTGGRNHT